MSKRIICAITLTALILSFAVFCLPAMAVTDKTVWDGTEVQPTTDADGDGYIDITLPSHLAWVVANEGNSGGKFELLNDIWLNDITVDTQNGTYTNNMETEPKSWYTRAVGAGKASATFNGSIAGNGFTIHGLFYNDETVETDKTSPGLIPFPKSATLTDIKIDNSFILKTGGSTVAAFCGRTHQITVNMLRCMVGENVYIKGPSGVAGFAGGGGSGSKVNIVDCVSLATVTGAGKLGGFAGDVWNATGWKINSSFTTSPMAVGTTKKFSNSANIYSLKGCTNSKAVSLENMMGTNAKTSMAFDFESVWMTTPKYPIPRVFFNSEIIMDLALVGNYIGLNFDFEVDGVPETPDSFGLIIDGKEYTVDNTYTIEAEPDAVYTVTPFVKYVENTFYGETEKLCAAVLANIEYKTADAVRRAELDENFKDSVIYKSGIWQTDGVVEKQPTADSDGDGYIDITEASELAWVVANNGKSGKYELLNDIVLNEITVDVDNETYESTLGLELHPWYSRPSSTFVGEIKGNGHIVRGIFYDDSELHFYNEVRMAGGLIPYPKNAIVTGVGVEDSYLKIHSNYAVGAIAGSVHGNTIKLTVDSCYAGKSVYINAFSAPGGILGGGGAKTSGYVRISNCYSLATLTFSREFHGGIIGNNWNAPNYSIKNCYSIGPIASNMGGEYAAFENNYSTAPDNKNGATVVSERDMQGYNARVYMSELDFENTWVTTDSFPTLRIFDSDLRGVDFGITEYNLDITDGIAFKLMLDGAQASGIEINGEDVYVTENEYTLKADADTVYTVRAFAEYDGARIYDKEYTLCAAVSAASAYAFADSDKKVALDALFEGSEIYTSNKDDSITFSLFSDFHYIQDGYISTIADLNAILKRANDNDAAFVMSAGDFCNNYAGSPELFKAYHQNEYGLPTYNVYGNHELQTSGNSMSNVTPSLTSGDGVVWGTEDGKIGDGSIGYYYFDNGGFRIIALDTTYSFEPATNEWEHNGAGSTSPEGDNIHTEALGPTQLAWLDRVLMDAADNDIPCIVVAHDGMSGLFATSSADAERVRGLFAKANAKNDGTVLMCINGHLHTNHQGYNEGVFYMDMNTVRNCLWKSNGTAHYSEGQTFMYENYDDEGNLIEIVEKNVTEVGGSTKTWYSADPLSAIVTVNKSGVITIDGVESKWLYDVAPASAAAGVEPRVSSGTYFDCDKTGHLYEVTEVTDTTETLTCKNALCGHTATREVPPSVIPDERLPKVELNEAGNGVSLDMLGSWATRVYWGYIGEEEIEYKWFDDFRLGCGTDYNADFTPRADKAYYFTKKGYYRFVLKCIISGDAPENYEYKDMVYTFYYDGKSQVAVPSLTVIDGNTVQIEKNGLEVAKLYYGNIGPENVPYGWFNDFWGKALATKSYKVDFGVTWGEQYKLVTKGFYNFVIVYNDADGVSHEVVYTVEAKDNIGIITAENGVATLSVDNVGGTVNKLYYGYIGSDAEGVVDFDTLKAKADTLTGDWSMKTGKTYNLTQKGYYGFCVNYTTESFIKGAFADVNYDIIYIVENK